MQEKAEFYNIDVDTEKEFSWVYSATQFEEVLAEALINQKLKRVFVSLYGYLESRDKRNNYFDFSYMGGALLLSFEHAVLELSIHAKGLMEYRLLSPWEVKISKNPTKDFLPNDATYLSDLYFYDLGKEFELDCFDSTLHMVNIEKTEVYPFYLSGFNEELGQEAEERCDLPSSINLRFKNGVILRLYGDDIEYYHVKIEGLKR